MNPTPNAQSARRITEAIPAGPSITLKDGTVAQPIVANLGHATTASPTPPTCVPDISVRPVLNATADSTLNPKGNGDAVAYYAPLAGTGLQRATPSPEGSDHAEASHPPSPHSPALDSAAREAAKELRKSIEDALPRDGSNKHIIKWPCDYADAVDTILAAVLRHVAPVVTKLEAERLRPWNPWHFCPECGSDEIRHEEGRHKQCAKCHQEWFSDTDYTAEVTREVRYIVVKYTDANKHLTSTEMGILELLAFKTFLGRKEDGKPRLETLVIESDWPEYNPTWKAIEKRMTQRTHTLVGGKWNAEKAHAKANHPENR